MFIDAMVMLVDFRHAIIGIYYIYVYIYIYLVSCKQENWSFDPFGAVQDVHGNIYARGAQVRLSFNTFIHVFICHQ